MKYNATIFAVCLTLILSFSVLPATASPKDDAVSLVNDAIAVYGKEGKAKVLQEISNPKGKYVKGELYVFVYDMTATILAHPINPKLIGKTLMDAPDSDGKFYRKEIVTLAKSAGSGWVNYKYTNPKTNAVEPKTTYFKKADDLIFCCGFYK